VIVTSFKSISTVESCPSVPLPSLSAKSKRNNLPLAAGASIGTTSSGTAMLIVLTRATSLSTSGSFVSTHCKLVIVSGGAPSSTAGILMLSAASRMLLVAVLSLLSDSGELVNSGSHHESGTW
jgi:hypothetical protein